MTNQFAACVLTGQEADALGSCVEHGGTSCIITVSVSPPVFDCVIPGFQCTHHHDIRKVEWQPIRPE